MTALVDTGLAIERVSEYPYTFFERFEGMVRDDEGRYRVGEGQPEDPAGVRRERQQATLSRPRT